MAQHTPVMGLTAMVKAGVGERAVVRWCGCVELGKDVGAGLTCDAVVE